MRTRSADQDPSDVMVESTVLLNYLPFLHLARENRDEWVNTLETYNRTGNFGTYNQLPQQVYINGITSNDFKTYARKFFQSAKSINHLIISRIDLATVKMLLNFLTESKNVIFKLGLMHLTQDVVHEIYEYVILYQADLNNLPVTIIIGSEISEPYVSSFGNLRFREIILSEAVRITNNRITPYLNQIAQLTTDNGNLQTSRNEEKSNFQTQLSAKQSELYEIKYKLSLLQEENDSLKSSASTTAQLAQEATTLRIANLKLRHENVSLSSRYETNLTLKQNEYENQIANKLLILKRDYEEKLESKHNEFESCYRQMQEDLESKLSQKQTELFNQCQQLDVAKQHNLAASSQISDLAIAYNKVNAELLKKTSEITQLKCQLEATQSEALQFKLGAITRQRETSKKADDLQIELFAKQAELSRANTNLTEQKKKLKDLKIELSDAHRKLVKNNSKVDRLQKKVECYTKQKQEISARLGKLHESNQIIVSSPSYDNDSDTTISEIIEIEATAVEVEDAKTLQETNQGFFALRQAVTIVEQRISEKEEGTFTTSRKTKRCENSPRTAKLHKPNEVDNTIMQETSASSSSSISSNLRAGFFNRENTPPQQTERTHQIRRSVPKAS